MKAVAVSQKCFDLKEAVDLKKLGEISPDFNVAPEGLSNSDLEKSDTTKSLTLELKPDGFWRTGDGSEYLKQKMTTLNENYDREPDSSPIVERYIDWTGNDHPKGKISEPYLVFPGASMKGALRHRTRFHLHRLAGSIENDMEWLFGSAKEEDKGQAGRVYVNDDYIKFEPNHIGRLTHVALDQFIQAPLDGALFSEEAVFGLPVTLSLQLETSDGTQNDNAIKALKMALTDVAEGRLALGGGAANGHGYFTADTMAIKNWMAEAPK